MIFDAKDMTVYNCEYDDTNRIDERSKLALCFQDQQESKIWDQLQVDNNPNQLAPIDFNSPQNSAKKDFEQNDVKLNQPSMKLRFEREKQKTYNEANPVTVITEI